MRSLQAHHDRVGPKWSYIKGHSMQQGCQIRHPNLVGLAPNGTNLGLLRSVSVHFGSVSQIVLKLILKSPRFVPFGASLTHFGGTPNIPMFCLSALGFQTPPSRQNCCLNASVSSLDSDIRQNVTTQHTFQTTTHQQHSATQHTVELTHQHHMTKQHKSAPGI